MVADWKRTLPSDLYLSELRSGEFTKGVIGQQFVLLPVGLLFKCHLTKGQCVITSTEPLKTQENFKGSPSKPYMVNQEQKMTEWGALLILSTY